MKPLNVVLIAAGWFTVMGAGHAGEKQAAAKSEAKGTVTLGAATYKMTSALAYESKRFNKKRTMVVLSEKPLDTTKLKVSLKKNGSDEDFFPFEPHLKLSFDEKGAFLQSFIFAEGANIIDGGDDNIKVTAAIKDGTVKGTAAMAKPGEFFKKAYQFDVAFDVALMPAAVAVPAPKTAVVPVPKPPVITKPPAAPKTAPAVPLPPPLTVDKEQRFEGKLTNDGPKFENKPAQIHRVQLSPGKTYVIDMESKDFDAYLRVLDAAGKRLASDDDGGGGHNARIRFTPPKEGAYQIVATRFGSDQGNYLLRISVGPLAAAEPRTTPKTAPAAPVPAPVAIDKEQRFEGQLTSASPVVKGRSAQIYSILMTPGKFYIIDMESKDFDAYLRVLDAAGKELASDDDGGGGRNARILFTPPKAGAYQVVATRYNSNEGNYLVKIRVRAAEKEMRFEGKLSNNDPKIFGNPTQIHSVKMSPGNTYIIDMESKDFDAYLRLRDAAGKELASNDDGGEGRNARIRFTPTNEDTYQVVATRFGIGQGNYLIRIGVWRFGDE